MTAILIMAAVLPLLISLSRVALAPAGTPGSLKDGFQADDGPPYLEWAEANLAAILRLFGVAETRLGAGNGRAKAAAFDSGLQQLRIDQGLPPLRAGEVDSIRQLAWTAATQAGGNLGVTSDARE